MWYNGELNKFPSNGYGQANPGGDFHEWGHFSQLVWAGTTKVGCVSKVCSAGTLSSMESIYTICNYSPAGMSSPLLSWYHTADIVQATWVANMATTSALPRACPA